MAFQFVKNLSVRWRLLGFIFCLLLFIVLAGAGGLLGMRDTKQSLSKVYNNQVKPMEEMRQINELFKFDVASTVEKVLYEQITWSDAVKRVESAKSKIDEKIDRLIADGDNDEQHESYAKMSEAKVVIQEVLAVLKKRDEDQLDGLFAGPIEPFLEEFGETITQIRHAGIQVTSSITEIAASTKQQEATANEHAATASEIAASTNQIAATSTNLMTTMKRVNSLTQNAAAAAEEGHTGLIHIDRTMVKMEEATGSIVCKLSILSEKAADIAGVVKTINKLADQTNLLSSFTIRCWTFDVRCSLCKFT